jgi:hypothetical protein
MGTKTCKFIVRILLVIKEMTDSLDHNPPREANHCLAGQRPPAFMEPEGLFLCWQMLEKWIKSVPSHPISVIRSQISSNPCLGLVSCLCRSGYLFVIPSMRDASLAKLEKVSS